MSNSIPELSVHLKKEPVLNMHFFCLIALYTICLASSQLLSYKLISIGPYVVSAATFIVPFWYLLGDMITELYGYQNAKKLISSSIIAALFFAIFVDFLVNLPSPASWQHQNEYNYVLGGMTRIAVANAIGSIAGGLINSKFLSRWKMLVQGRYFVMRSITCSIIGQMIFICIALTIVFAGKEPVDVILELMTASLIVKSIISLLFSYPVSLVVYAIKNSNTENMVTD